MSGTSTIAALATAPAPAGVAVVRVSGPDSASALRALFRSPHDPVDDPRRLVFGTVVSHPTGEILDSALAVFMPGPRSFTGEDVAEIQFHGSPLLAEKILRSLFSLGVTPAQPGEFSKRAFLNGKIDLVQAEAIADVIAATTDQALSLAREHLQGRFSASVNEIGEPLRDVLAELEASVDFPEEDIEPEKRDALLEPIRSARARIEALLSTYSYGRLVQEGFRVLLFGKPNVGKSSMLNALLGTRRAIVSEVSGTTRDLIEEQVSLEGYRFIFCDSAGVAETDDTVEKIGVSLTRERIDWADLVLFVIDAAGTDTQWQATLEQELRGRAKKIWMVTNKIDVNPGAIGTYFCDSSICAQNFYVSAKRGEGMTTLMQALVEEVATARGGGVEATQVLTNERHRLCLTRASATLAQLEAVWSTHPVEVLCAEMRHALSAIEELVGKTRTEDILGRIFSKFCVGK